MKPILLTRGMVAMVDDADYEHLSQYNWYASPKGNTCYATRRMKKDQNPSTPLISMHQEIMGKRDGLVTDHINGDGLCNCRDNLRFVTRRQNNQNRHTKKLSKYPGVTWAKNKCRWKSCIQINGKSVFLGSFKDELDAFNAYKDAVNELGESVIWDEEQVDRRRIEWLWHGQQTT